MQSRPLVRLPFRNQVRVPVLLLALTIAPSVAHAQVISNPSSIRFAASADQNTISANGEPVVGGYALQIFQYGSTQPLKTLDLGKPEPDADGAITADISSLTSDPTLQGLTLEAEIVTFGPAGSSTSTLSNAFVFGSTTTTNPPPPTTNPPPPGPTPSGGTAIAVPGTIQAENFDNGGEGVAYHDTTAGNSGGQYRATDVDIEGTTDTGGGYNVGWIAVGEWLGYTVNVTTAGNYTVQARVASNGAGGTFHLEAGTSRSASITIPNTGGWQTWQTVTVSGFALSAGTQFLRIVFDTQGTVVGNLNYVSLSLPATTTGSTPYSGTPIAVPGTIQAENFDKGGEGVAYHDTTAGNSGGQYRTTDVDIEGTSDTGGGYNVGWIAVGEWLGYTVNVTTAGSYTIQARVASNGAGGTFHLEAGTSRSASITIPNTGGWQTWQTVTVSGFALSAGTQVVRVVFDTQGTVVGNLNYISLSLPAATTGSTPYSGTPIAVPGTIQAENFDKGGEGVAYHDTTAGNSGGQYRTTDVDIEGTSDTGAGYNVGWIAVGEWLGYTVNVTTAGSYTIQARVASNGAGGTFHLEAGTSRSASIQIPNTGGWQTWQTVTVSGFALNAGTQFLRIVFDTQGTVVGNLNYVKLAIP